MQHEHFIITVTSLWARWRRKSPASQLFTQPLIQTQIKKTSKLRVTGLCVGNSSGTGEFPAQMASNTANFSIWWRHHVDRKLVSIWAYKRHCMTYGQITKRQIWVLQETISPYSEDLLYTLFLLCSRLSLSESLLQVFKKKKWNGSHFTLARGCSPGLWLEGSISCGVCMHLFHQFRMHSCLVRCCRSGLLAFDAVVQMDILRFWRIFQYQKSLVLRYTYSTCDTMSYVKTNNAFFNNQYIYIYIYSRYTFVMHPCGVIYAETIRTRNIHRHEIWSIGLTLNPTQSTRDMIWEGGDYHLYIRHLFSYEGHSSSEW